MKMMMTVLWSPTKLVLLASSLLLTFSNHATAAQMDEEEMEVEGWFDLIRYMVGLSFVIFAIFALLYRPIATRSFLRRFQKPDGIEEINGMVVACDELKGFVKKYELEVYYTAKYTSTRRGTDCLLLERCFLTKVESNWNTPPGTPITLIMLKNLPRSACTRDWVKNEQDQAGTTSMQDILILIPALCLFTLLAGLCVHEITSFPQKAMISGWLIFAAVNIVVFWMSWSFVDYQFEQSIRQRILKAVPLKEHERGEPADENKEVEEPV